MGVCTKTGDKGLTSLYTGERVKKSSLRVKTYGTVDELSSTLGLARAFAEDDEVREICLEVQKLNGLLMADFASIGKETLISEDTIKKLESLIEDIEKSLPPMTCFLLAGESKGGSFLDLARTVARRAERLAWELSEQEEVSACDIKYLNRVSDLCFLLMRKEEKR